MKGFLLGLVVAALGSGGYMFWKERWGLQGRGERHPVSPSNGSQIVSDPFSLT